MKAVWSLILPLVLAASVAGAAPPDLAKEREALFALDKAWAQAALAKDIDKTLSYWADDAQVIPPGQAAVSGKEALRKYLATGFAIPGFAIEWDTKEFVVSASGDMAYGVGTNKVTIGGPQGEPLAQPGRAVTVWRKKPGGTWKCVLDIWNADPFSMPGMP